MSRLDRLFTQAFTAEGSAHAPPPRSRRDAADDDVAEANEAEAAQAADPTEAQAILAAFKKKDYAACLGLPPITLDALGRPEWPVTDSQLSRAFRMRSLRVHPDKNPAPDAREAFDALNATQRLLLDASKRGEYVREEGEKMLQQMTHDQPEAMLRIRKAREAAAAEAFSADVRAQAERQAERAKLRKEQAAQRAAARAREESDEESDSDDDAGAAGAAGGRGGTGAAVRGRGRGKRGRPSFLF